MFAFERELLPRLFKTYVPEKNQAVTSNALLEHLLHCARLGAIIPVHHYRVTA